MGKTLNTPKIGIGTTLLIRVGKSIWLKWVKLVTMITIHGKPPNY